MELFEMLDMWQALGCHPNEFHTWINSDRWLTREDAWAQLVAAVRGDVALIAAARSRYIVGPERDRTPDKDETEHAALLRRGLLPNPDQCMAAEWTGLPADPTRLESEYQLLLAKLARELERTEGSYQQSVREGYQLREELSRMAQAVEYLASCHPLTDAQREMVTYLLRADG